MLANARARARPAEPKQIRDYGMSETRCINLDRQTQFAKMFPVKIDVPGLRERSAAVDQLMKAEER